MRLTTQPFGTTRSGDQIQVHILSDDLGTSVRLIDYGASLISLRTPDRDGRTGEITLGYGTIASYEADEIYAGRTVGRFANRIGDASFVLGDEIHRLAKNANSINHIHGGPGGLHSVTWDAETWETDSDVGVAFTHHSPHLTEDYPGNIDVTVTYTLTRDRELRIFETATTDRPTILNLTNHTYFNLGTTPTILDHTVRIDAAAFIPISSYGIPIAGPQPVAGEMDLRQAARIGSVIDSDNEHVSRMGGFDHTWVLAEDTDEFTYPIHVSDPATGRWLAAQTDKPGVRFYTGNNLSGSRFERYGGLCLETMYFEDSPNQPDFPSTMIAPDNPYAQVTTFSFGAS